MLNPFKIVLGAVGRVLSGSKGGPLAVGVVDQLDVGEWGIVAAGVGVGGGVLVLLSAVSYFIVKFANWLFT